MGISPNDTGFGQSARASIVNPAPWMTRHKCRSQTQLKYHVQTTLMATVLSAMNANRSKVPSYVNWRSMSNTNLPIHSDDKITKITQGSNEISQVFERR